MNWIHFSFAYLQWLNWISHFSEADHKPLGIAKTFKAQISEFLFLLFVENKMRERKKRRLNTEWQRHTSRTRFSHICYSRMRRNVINKMQRMDKFIRYSREAYEKRAWASNILDASVCSLRAAHKLTTLSCVNEMNVTPFELLANCRMHSHVHRHYPLQPLNLWMAKYFYCAFAFGLWHISSPIQWQILLLSSNRSTKCIVN